MDGVPYLFCLALVAAGNCSMPLLATTGKLVNGETVKIGTQTHTFRDALTPSVNEILIATNEKTEPENRSHAQASRRSDHARRGKWRRSFTEVIGHR